MDNSGWPVLNELRYANAKEGVRLIATEFSESSPVNCVDSYEIPTQLGNHLVTEIGRNIYFPSNIKSLNLPVWALRVDVNAFKNSSIESICLNRNLMTVDFLQTMSSLKNITTKGNPYFQVVDGNLYDVENRLCWAKNENIRSGITSVKAGAFSFRKFGDIKIPDGVKSIERMAFYKCEAKSLTIPSSVTKIDGYAICKSQIDELIIEGGNEPLSLYRNSIESEIVRISLPKRIKYKDTPCVSLEKSKIVEILGALNAEPEMIKLDWETLKELSVDMRNVPERYSDQILYGDIANKLLLNRRDYVYLIKANNHWQEKKYW